MATENIDINLNLKTGNVSGSLGELRDKLKELQDQLEKNEVIGTEGFEKLQKEIQDTSSQIKILDKNMEGLEPQQKAEAFLKMGEGIAGGFMMAQGAMGLMGAESENLEKIQVKVQSAIAIAMGVRMISEAALMANTAKRVFLEKASTVTTKANTVVTYAAAAAQRVLSKGLGITIKGLKGLKLAVAATGILGLVAGVATLVSKLTGSGGSGGATKGVSEFQKKMNALNRELEDANKLLGRDREKMLREIGEVEENEHDKRKRETEEQIEDLKARAAALAEEKDEVQDYINSYNDIRKFPMANAIDEANEFWDALHEGGKVSICLLYTSPSPRDGLLSRMPSSA